ncbi:hypothetical protein ACFU99_03885 [Streptomyces sp. NPDC057654]|uniref:hypothetical protein n=1 Tax=Streptomyces sp. NPDC057654 TaxID=3346196 RepID=UPI0036798B58
MTPSPAPSPADAATERPSSTAYEVRPGRTADRSAVINLIAGRIALLNQWTDVGPLKGDSATLLNHLGESEGGQPVVWMLCEDSTILGCAAVFPKAPYWTGDPDQRAEPAHYIAALFIYPTPGVLLARLLVFALLDRAARLPTEDGRTRWLRSATSSDRVMRYAHHAMGFAVSGGVARGPRLVHLLQQPARAIDGLATYVSTRTT